MSIFQRIFGTRPSLARIAYVSMVAPETSAEGVQSLAARAAQCNRELDISGVLVFNGRNFMQIIEGPTGPLNSLMDRIRRDPRHYNVEVQFDEAVDHRCFADWALQLILPLDREVPPVPPHLEPALQGLWRTFGMLR